MKITVENANSNMLSHSTRPIMRFLDLSKMIHLSSLLGYESLNVWVPKNKAGKWNRQLRDLGFKLKTYYPKSLPEHALVEIHWNMAEFIEMDEEKELDL